MIRLVHKNALNSFTGTARNKNFIEYKIAERQLVMKNSDGIANISNDLPSRFFLFDKQLANTEWKRMLNQKVHSHAESSLSIKIH